MIHNFILIEHKVNHNLFRELNLIFIYFIKNNKYNNLNVIH
ncbi:hypothetical protein ACI8B_120052 [Acinetobacter proteolyticus]|uniref:Uncharacterized protein n=1 Tax=Acinetobacter proteolyticus TaxID=1776741 RepID=A0A653K0E0_9GAMM|nr:hypothetical protein ACI8B_120052 [Acinetobacter proteolyticus]